MEPKSHILLGFGLIFAQPKMRAVSVSSVTAISKPGMPVKLKAQRTATCTKFAVAFGSQDFFTASAFLGRRALRSLYPSLFPSHTTCCTHVLCLLGMLMMFNHILGLPWLPTASGASLSGDERKLHTKPPSSQGNPSACCLLKSQ